MRLRVEIRFTVKHCIAAKKKNEVRAMGTNSKKKKKGRSVSYA